MAHDVVVIGGGISGLVSAILLAETGRKVVVLEQHRVLGGYLQQFRRKDTVFDVGFHYMGSTAKGRPMRQFLEHLQVWDRLQVVPFGPRALVSFPDGGHTDVLFAEGFHEVTLGASLGFLDLYLRDDPTAWNDLAEILPDPSVATLVEAGGLPAPGDA